MIEALTRKLPPLPADRWREIGSLLCLGGGLERHGRPDRIEGALERIEAAVVGRSDEAVGIDPNGVYRPEDLVRLLSVGRTSLYAWMAEGLRYADVPGGRRILGSDVIAFVKNRSRSS